MIRKVGRHCKYFLLFLLLLAISALLLLVAYLIEPLVPPSGWLTHCLGLLLLAMVMTAGLLFNASLVMFALSVSQLANGTLGLFANNKEKENPPTD